MTNLEIYDTIKYYRKNKHLLAKLTEGEVELLRDNLGSWFDYIDNKDNINHLCTKPAKKYPKSQWKQYQQEVIKLTKLQPIDFLENSDKPRSKNWQQLRSMDYYVIDHKISIWYGFKNNIPPEQIADISNLRWIPGLENAIKGTNCIF